MEGRTEEEGGEGRLEATLKFRMATNAQFSRQKYKSAVLNDVEYLSCGAKRRGFLFLLEWRAMPKPKSHKKMAAQLMQQEVLVLPRGVECRWTDHR